VVDRYLDCANPRCGFARIRCPDYARECLVTFSCKTSHFCPSCHAQRREAWSIWLSRHLLLPVPHRQVVFAVPKIIRPFFRYNRGLLGDLYSLPGDRRDHSPPGDHLHLPEASAGGRSGGTLLIPCAPQSTPQAGLCPHKARPRDYERLDRAGCPGPGSAPERSCLVEDSLI